MRTALLFAVLLLTAIASRAAAQDAIFQVDAARTGVVEKLDLPEQPTVLWKFQPAGDGGRVPDFGGVLAAGARVLVTDRDGYLYTLHAADGKELWKQFDAGSTSQAPLVMGDLVYLASTTGVYAFSLPTGDGVWHFEIAGGGNESSPLMLGDLIVVAGVDGNVYGVDAQTGQERWTHSAIGDAPPDPPGFDGRRARIGDNAARPRIAAADDTTLYQPFFDQSRVVAYDGRTGDSRWSFQAKGWIYAHPVVAGDSVFIGSQDALFYCLDKNTGKVRWSFRTGARIEAGAAVSGNAMSGDAVYVGSCDGHLYRLNAKTGEKQWSFRCDPSPRGRPCPIYAAPLIAGDVVYLAGMEGQVYSLNAADGSLRWKFRPSENSEIDSNLATDGQRLFLTTRRNEQGGENAVWAIGVKK